MPKVSVIISTYNRVDLLPRAINSVLGQMPQDFELIIVDDGSVDNTKEIVGEFQKKDAQIKYIWQENSGGAAKPKNTGIKSAQGEYIAILDSDDEWLPGKLEKQVNLFEKSANPRLGFVGCNSFIVYENGKKKLYEIPRYKQKYFLENILTRDFMGSGSGIMYKKSVFGEIGYFDENLKSGQDYEMRIRLLQKYDFDFVNEPLFKYYYHGENISGAIGSAGKERDLEYIFNKHGKHYENNRRIYSVKLRYDGLMYALMGDATRAKRNFLKSIKINPLNFKSYGYLFLSLFSFNFYLKRKQHQRGAGELYENIYKKNFSFGGNWLKFFNKINNQKIELAKSSLRNFTKLRDFQNKSFIDIGCGSGLFSLAANLLNAEKVVSADIDEYSLNCAKTLKDKYGISDDKWIIKKLSILDFKSLENIGKFDIVYAWGVLHHTGNMRKALKNVANMVRDNGLLYLAIYNNFKGFPLSSKKWRSVKKFYSKSGAGTRKIMRGLYLLYFITGLLMTGKNPISYIRNYEKRGARGMDFFRDIEDWLGGYPYEFAVPEKIINFYGKLGFILVNIKKTNREGCNEFLFKKPSFKVRKISN